MPLSNNPYRLPITDLQIADYPLPMLFSAAAARVSQSAR
jgi:hypothetical protein